MNPKIVTHFIAGYPNYEASLEVARGLIAGGAYALEMQIPFSDPNADGPVIEGACRVALDEDFKVSDAWRLLEAIRAESDIPVFVMSYASLVFTPGVDTFVRRAKDAGASGLIIPDLVPGADEGLFTAAADAGCPAVPVVVPWITDERLDEIL
ncbi:MAG: tryptophan synthase subunit alpha, partial [Spirochaetaceae bacterium]|nr:tryptophan synthase subunit alpha [Spirochaetaceae bacterium]